MLAGLSHIFVCSQNLKYAPGSVRATNFRLGSTDPATAILNENWAMFLRVRVCHVFQLVASCALIHEAVCSWFDHLKYQMYALKMESSVASATM